MFNWCYHGTVDETLVTLADDGRRVSRAKATSARPSIPALTTKVVEFNDLDALERRARAAATSRACSRSRSMTNIGIIHPDPGYHDALRELTRDTGTLLIIDETHTICAGPGGYTREHGLEPDLFTIGKPIAAGLPDRGVRHDRGGRGPGAAERRPGPTATSAGSAARSPATRSTLAAMRRDADRGADRRGVRAHAAARARGGPTACSR